MINATETKLLQARIPLDLYNETAAIFDEIGLSFTDGIRVYLNKVRCSGGVPFSLSRTPNAETARAMRNVEMEIGLHKISSADFDNLIDVVQNENA